MMTGKMKIRTLQQVFLAGTLLILSGCANYLRSQIYQPEPLENTKIDFAGEAPLDVSVTTADGLTLHSYYWPPAESNDTLLVYFHGNGGNKLTAAGTAQKLRTGGHGVLVASYRGYSGNPGKPTEDGLFSDGDAWMAKAHELVPDAHLFVFGHSLGGAVALEMATRHKVDGVATLGTFSRLAAAAPAYARGVLPDRFDNLDAIARVKAPVYLFHGTADEVVPYSSAAKLKAASVDSAAEVIPLEDGGHQVPMEKLAPYVWERLLGKAG